MREYFSFRRYCSGKKEKFAKPSFFWYDEKENVQNSIQNKIFVEIEKTLRGFIMERIEKKELKKLIRENVKTLYRKTLENASPEELYQAAVFAVRDVITDKWMKTHDEYYERDAKVVYYLSMEFLMGRFFGNALINLEMIDEVKEVFAELGIDYNMVEEAEPDPGLGNGGLGRLAACFLESLSTLSRLTAVGFAIITASLSSGLKTAIRSRCRITGWKTATPGALNGMNMPLRSNLAAMCAQWKRATANIALCRKIISL